MRADPSGYSVLMREWATRALGASLDAKVFVESAEPSVTLGGGPAQRLLGLAPELAPSTTALADILRQRGFGPVKFTDTFGFSRPVYYPLLIHLHLFAYAEESLARELLAADRSPLARQEPPLQLWWALCLHEAAAIVEDEGAGAAACELVEAVTANPGDKGTLHRRQGLDDLLDAWTFRELSGLHALAWMAIRTGNAGWWHRVHEVTAAHQDITQPDYTTYQPWGVYAFLLRPDTILFGEQQLHDSVTNLHVEQGGAGLVPGLLLADAAAALDAAAATDPSLRSP